MHDRRKLVDGETVSQDMDISPGDSTPTSETSYSHTPARDVNSSVNTVLLANALPRLASHPIATTAAASFSPTSSSLSISSSAPPTAVTTSNVPGPPPTNLRVITQTKISESGDTLSPQKPTVVAPIQSNLTPLQVDTTMGSNAGEGPPTPTHSETQDGIDARKSKLFHLSFRKFPLWKPCGKLISFCFQ